MAVDASAVARVVGIETIAKNLREAGGITFLPRRIAVVGQGNSLITYPLTKLTVTSALDAANVFGFGSPIHLVVSELLPPTGDGVGTIPVTIYPLADDGTAVASAGLITPTVVQTVAASYVVKVNNISSEAFVISVGDDEATTVTAMTEAINAVLDMPIIAVDGTTKVDFTSKWKGASAHGIVVEIEGSLTAGTTFAITQATGGLVNPDVDDALNQIGNVWETDVVNCMDVGDTATLTKFTTFGEGRWGALVRKPLVVFTGNAALTVDGASAISDTRKTDRVNAQLVAPGSKNLPFVIAAAELAKIVVLANNNPPHDYGSQDVPSLTPGVDGDQWDYIKKDAAVKKGSSTIDVKDSVVNISDVVTFYHPTGDVNPAYRFVVDIVKVQQIIFNMDLIFATKEWDGAPLIPDDQPTVNPTAKKPKTAITAVASMVDNLALQAIISDPVAAKESIVAAINSQNAKRLDLSLDAKVSGNSNIISIGLNWGFHFGTPSIESITLGGREFAVAADAESQRKLGGWENEVQANGNGTARLIKTRVPLSIDGLTLDMDDSRGDHEYLQDFSNGNDFKPIAITYASGITYQATAQIVGETQSSSQNATCAVSLMGPGVLTKQ